MPSAFITWHGIPEFDAAIDRISERVRETTRAATIEAAHAIQIAMQRRAGEGGRHKVGTPTPASVGGGPAVITGTLRRSIVVGKSGPFGTTGWRASIGPTVIYGRRVELEYNYPYAAPGLHDAYSEVSAIYRRAWGIAIHE